jgi:hypothetical protein
MADFNAQDPPKSVTGGAPKNAVAEYPKHLHKPGGQFVVVNNATEEAEQIAQGWSVEVPTESSAMGGKAPKAPETPAKKPHG